MFFSILMGTRHGYNIPKMSVEQSFIIAKMLQDCIWPHSFKLKPIRNVFLCKSEKMPHCLDQSYVEITSWK